jgi:hypothetical protein
LIENFNLAINIAFGGQNRLLSAASTVRRGSHTGQAISNDGFFFVYQSVRIVASFLIFTI